MSEKFELSLSSLNDLRYQYGAEAAVVALLHKVGKMGVILALPKTNGSNGMLVQTEGLIVRERRNGEKAANSQLFVWGKGKNRMDAVEDMFNRLLAPVTFFPKVAMVKQAALYSPAETVSAKAIRIVLNSELPLDGPLHPAFMQVYRGPSPSLLREKSCNK